MHEPAWRRYAEWMAGQPIGGVAVWAHTGRGLRLSEEDGAPVLTPGDASCPRAILVIAAAGARADRRSPAEVIDRGPGDGPAGGRPRGRRPARPPAGRLPRPRRIATARSSTTTPRSPRPACRWSHSTCTRPRAGSPTRRKCSPSCWPGRGARDQGRHARQRDDLPGCRPAGPRRRPGKVLITGEDRFLGYSLMCGARAALIGMAAACTGLQAELLRAYWEGDAARFLALCRGGRRPGAAHLRRPDGGLHPADALVPGPSRA